MVIAIIAALLAAAANASSSVLQRKADRDEPDELAMSPRLIIALLQRPVWLAGIGAIIVGFLLQALALGSGQLSLVEPLLVLELPLTLLLASRVFHRQLHRAAWIQISAMTVGLIALAYCLHPRGGQRSDVSALHWVLGIGVTLGVVALLVALGWRAAHRNKRAALYGIATGISFGLTASLVAVMSSAASHGITHIFTTWQTYGLVATGLLGMFLQQNALQAGPLVTAQPGFTLADPLVAVTWGIVIFGEQVRTGPWLAGELGGGLLIAIATIGLARSPLLRVDPATPTAVPSEGASTD
jgi:drug/metabolite transporter (DMT)-like permease